MNKILVLYLVLVCCFLGGCSEKYVPASIAPADILTLEDVETAVGNCEYTLEFDAVVNKDNNTYVLSYLPVNFGAGDPVFVEVTYPYSDIKGESTKKMYDDCYESRVNKQKVEGIGEEAFVAFPSITIYKNRLLLKITAGSGDTKEQLDLLLSLGKLAVKNMDTYLSAN